MREGGESQLIHACARMHHVNRAVLVGLHRVKPQ